MNIIQYINDFDYSIRQEKVEDLAKKVGVSVSTVRSWMYFTRFPHALKVDKIEKATNNMVTRYDLRPDLFKKSKNK